MESKTVSGMILTLLLMGMLTLAFNIQPVKAESRTWTVDDDGEADFTRIQNAIWAASPGDTIYVYNGIYFENLYVNKDSLTIVGESKSNTIIDGRGNVVIDIYKNKVSVSGFTVRNGGQSWFYIWGSAILLDYARYCNISDNIVTNSRYGITSYRGKHNIINGNTISDVNQGTPLYYSYNETVIGNTISNGVQYGSYSPYGSEVTRSSNNVISGNTISEFEEGLSLYYSHNNIIEGNIISNSTRRDPYWGGGIYLWYSNNNSVAGNMISNTTELVFCSTPSTILWLATPFQTLSGLSMSIPITIAFSVTLYRRVLLVSTFR